MCALSQAHISLALRDTGAYIAVIRKAVGRFPTPEALRESYMRANFMLMAAAGILLAACSSAPEELVEMTSKGESAIPLPPPASSQIAAVPMTSLPEGPAKGGLEDFVLNVGDRIFFNTDKSELTADARKTLERQAAWLQQYSNFTVTVEGHADERGTREYNLALGERRATSVKSYMVALGIDPNRVATISYGKERPEVLGSNEASWAQNRRGVTVLN